MVNQYFATPGYIQPCSGNIHSQSRALFDRLCPETAKKDLMAWKMPAAILSNYGKWNEEPRWPPL